MPQVFPEIQLVLWYENSVKVETKNSLIEYGTNGVIGRSRTNLVHDVRKTFSLQGILRDRNEINDFLLSNRGKPFVFRPYNDSYSSLFICSNWTWRWTALNVWEFSATFSEVFRPGWIPTDIPYRMEAGSESSADLILEVPSIYLLYNGSQSGAFLGLVDPYSLNAGVQSSGNLRLENGIFEPYTLFTGNENGASLIAGEVVVQTYVLIAGDESGAVVVTPGYFLLFSGSESGSVLSLGEGTTPPYELNTGVESSANIILGEPSGVVYYLNGGSESSAVVSVLTDLVFDLNTGNESGANLELNTSPLLVGLLAWWEFEESSGTRNDSHSSSLNLTQVGTINNSTGKVAQSANISPGTINAFSNAANYLQRDGSFIPTSTQYWAGWINLTAGTNNAVFLIASKYGPFEYEGGPGNRQIAILYDRTQAQPLRIIVSSTGSSASEKAIGVSCNRDEWVFFEAYYDSVSTNIGIAVNNGSFSILNTGYSSIFNATTATFKVGYYFFNSVSGSNSNRFLIDELAIWNRMLTTEERTLLWNGGAGRSYTG